MANQSAVTTINKVVDRFLIKYKLPKEDYLAFREHAYDLVRSFRMYHDNYPVEEEVTIVSPGLIVMPDDLIDVIGVYYTEDKNMWPLTHRPDMVITGEDAGSTVQLYGVGYGTPGGRNIGYWRENWTDREIYIDGLDVGTSLVLVYISTGINSDGDTIIPVEQVPVFDAYLRWQQAKIYGMPFTEQKLRADEYKDRLQEYRRFHIGSIEELMDVIYSSYGQAPKR